MAWEITPWRPFRDLERIKREIDRVWDSFFETKPVVKTGEPGEWFPSLDVTETKDDIVVKAEIPGMEAKDIDISLNNDILTIKGEKKQEKEEKQQNYHLVERTYGNFIRMDRLPGEVKSDNINASYKNGVLNISLPKSEEAKKKEVKIKVS